MIDIILGKKLMAKVPSLESSLYLNDPESIIAYTLRKYSRTPKDTVPVLKDMIISLTWDIAEYGRDPDNLVRVIQTNLQNTFNRIFENDRQISVNVIHQPDGNGNTTVVITISYTTKTGDLKQTGTRISLDKNGQFVIPEDMLKIGLN